MSMDLKMYPNVKIHLCGLDNWKDLTKSVGLNEMRFSHEMGKNRKYIMVKNK
jgi:hypothetical protein